MHRNFLCGMLTAILAVHATVAVAQGNAAQPAAATKAAPAAPAKAAPAPAAANTPQPQVPAPSVAAKSFVLIDVQSGTTLAQANADERFDPASLTKLMTAYLTFRALKDKKLDLKQNVNVSEKAWKAEGSRMFIEPRKPVTVEELLHGMIVQSGNDASIALAEAVAGTEDVFAQLMNKEAQRMGLKNTNFLNATGLPNAQHHSSARDIAALAANLIRDFPDFYPIYSKKEYAYNNITQANRNRLLWIDPAVDGVKTGHTESAGFCLAASAKKGDRRLISVVMGTASDTMRMQESQRLLNYGFQNFDTRLMYKKGEALATPTIYKGEANQIRIGVDKDTFVTLPRERFNGLAVELAYPQPLVAPYTAGQNAGIMKLKQDGATVLELPVVALDNVAAAGFFGRMYDSVRLMLKKQGT